MREGFFWGEPPEAPGDEVGGVGDVEGGKAVFANAVNGSGETDFEEGVAETHVKAQGKSGSLSGSRSFAPSVAEAAAGQCV